MIPIQSPSDFSNLIKDAKLQVKWVIPRDRNCNSLNKKVWFSDSLPCTGMLYECLITAKVRWIWSDGTFVAYGNAGGLDADYITLSDGLKATVEWVKVTLNNKELINNS